LQKGQIRDSQVSSHSDPGDREFEQPNHLQNHFDSGEDNLVLEMCDFLELENAKLENLLKAYQGEIHNIRFDAAACKIIPHYRLALTR
jgi:hypothetical protein